MKAKLIKTSNDIYDLFEGTRFISTTDSPDDTANKLSLKNCQAIERGYNLDELFQREIDELMFTGNLEDPSEYRSGMYKGASILLKLMGDKKFSKEDIKKMMKSASYGWFEADFDKHLATLQQDIWDVEIIEECLDKDCDGVDRKGDCITTGKPKLDADGCLILKKI